MICKKKVTLQSSTGQLLQKMYKCFMRSIYIPKSIFWPIIKCCEQYYSLQLIFKIFGPTNHLLELLGDWLCLMTIHGSAGSKGFSLD
jgi:hypothetical protein